MNIHSKKFFFSFILISSTLLIFPFKGLSDQCLQGNCNNGYGVMQTDAGGFVKGQFINGKLNGKGILKTREGDIYEGNFLNNKFDGYGILKNKDASVVYSGYHKNGLSHGYGVLENHIKGMVYAGDWRDGTFVEGIFEKSDGTKYIGELKNNLFHGKGELTLPNPKKSVIKLA